MQRLPHWINTSHTSWNEPRTKSHRDGADEPELPDLADDRVRLPGADGHLLVAALHVVAVEEAAVRVHHPLTETPAHMCYCVRSFLAN